MMPKKRFLYKFGSRSKSHHSSLSLGWLLPQVVVTAAVTFVIVTFVVAVAAVVAMTFVVTVVTFSLLGIFLP